ncbi:hypothetical protein [Methylobacterium sp. JK268]
MPRAVTCQIVERAGAGFAVVGILEPDTMIVQEGFATPAAAEAWIDGLRAIMAACGAPVRRGSTVAIAPSAPRDRAAPRPSRTGRDPRPPRAGWVRPGGLDP